MKLMKCPSCGEYAIRSSCPSCGVETVVARPPRYSPKDKYARYRRMWKLQCNEEP